ncbi:hypothetical protein [Methylacidiphilum kamchatkense]|uniref:Uncharacterized protein n=1 Tax=Methylacidiphilum kamchatkense Kam1 TaxID=1202785 RepID=A0A516TPR5_9BACT|nr:hypothetical protein [Methylacidiphilum kamchatkense]QDQ43233.1 hypothetical protein kam1_2024 [Methylacidiphilum kamchatkense Kam1]
MEWSFSQDSGMLAIQKHVDATGKVLGFKRKGFSLSLWQESEEGGGE